MELDPGLIYSFATELLKEDLGRGDLTTQAVVRGGIRARGKFIAKQSFILCGLEIAEAVFSSMDPHIQIESRVYDGDSIDAGDEFARVEGAGQALLAGERTALNILQRLSAVATVTRSFVDRIDGTGARIVDTRKTTPGIRMLEKYAVTVGGGFNHRFGLDDGILIKDNHIALAGGVKRAIQLARAAAPHLFKIEVEVGNESQFREALGAGADVVMLDNMQPELIRECVRIARQSAPSTVIEASGGVSIENAREIAECGVDIVSVGALTHSAAAVDISLKMTPL